MTNERTAWLEEALSRKMTDEEMAAVIAKLETIRRENRSDEHATPERFDLEAKSSMELASPTYDDPAVIALEARGWKRINDPRRMAKV